jgi:protein gp37
MSSTMSSIYKSTKSTVGKDTVNPLAGTEDAVVTFLCLNGYEIQLPEQIDACGSGGFDKYTVRKKKKWNGKKDTKKSGGENNDAGDVVEKDNSLDMNDENEGENIMTYHTYDVADVITFSLQSLLMKQ